MLPLFAKFNVLFQAEKSVIHMLYSECQLLFQQFISSYFKADVIDSCVSVVDVDFANNSNHLSQENICWKKTVLDPKQRKKFATINLLVTRFPNLVDEEKLDDLEL